MARRSLPRLRHARNTFAFEDALTFSAFIPFLPPHLKLIVGHVSLVTYLPSNNLTAEPSDFDPRPYRKVFRLLRQLANLASLELDSLFLPTNLTLQPFRRLGFRSLR